MTGMELGAIAREAIPPVGATMAVAAVEHEPGRRLANGTFAGDGGRTTYRAVWFDGLRRLAPIGPAFDRSRDAFRLVDLINGHDRPASRKPASDLATDDGHLGAVVDASRDEEPASEAPVTLGMVPVRLCDGCDKPLPRGARRGRRCHGPACRAAAFRRRQAAERNVSVSSDAARSDVTLSSPTRPPGAADDPGPTSRAAADGGRYPASASARDARPDAVPADPDGPPSLGLE